MPAFNANNQHKSILHKMRPDERDIMVKYANESYCGKISLYVMGVFCVEVSLKKHIQQVK